MAALLVAGGCSSPPRQSGPPRMGANANLADFTRHPAAYKGKVVTLTLKADEAIDGGDGQAGVAGRDVKFSAAGPRAERVRLVVTIPAGLSVSKVGQGDAVVVAFTCTRGELRQGNVAKVISPL